MGTDTPRFLLNPYLDLFVWNELERQLEHIFAIFQYLWEPPVRQTLKVHTIVDAIQHLLDDNPRAKALISPWVASLLSKLSVVSECLRQLNFFQPWAKHVANQVKEHRTELLIALGPAAMGDVSLGPTGGKAICSSSLCDLCCILDIEL